MGCGATKSVDDTTDEEKEAMFSVLTVKEANPLALALNKHFRDLLSECDYRAHENTEAYERMFNSRGEFIKVNSNSRQAKTQGIHKKPLDFVQARDITEIFLGHAMRTLDRKKWDGSFNYQFSRRGQDGSVGETVVFLDRGDGVVEDGNSNKRNEAVLILKGTIKYPSYNNRQVYTCDSDVEFGFFVYDEADN